MPPSGYLSVTGIETGVQHLATTYPSLCQLIALPETSIEGRTSRAVKIAAGGGADRRGILIVGGVHARELINPDLVLAFGLKLCQAYTAGTGLTFGGKVYDAAVVQLLVNALDIFLFPLVNPDGRAYVQSPTGYAMWRKNRNLNPGQPCRGVDLNRNFDYLWPSGIGTSADTCSDVYKGGGPFSEPEVRNVRHLLDAHANIRCFVDVHSFAETILYPWGDDDNQTSDPSMNFRNPAHDGLRGTPGDSLYKEFIPSTDLAWYTSTGGRVRDAIAAARGRAYTIEQSIGLYPTTATSDDYVYARHFVDPSKRKVRGFTIETGTEFQPPYAEAFNVITEIAAGLVECCLACLCTPEEMLRGAALAAEALQIRALPDLRLFQALHQSPAGRRYVAFMEDHGAETMDLLRRDEQLLAQLSELLPRLNEVARTWHDAAPREFDPGLVAALDEFLQALTAAGSAPLQESAGALRRDLSNLRGQTVLEGLEMASQANTS